MILMNDFTSEPVEIRNSILTAVSRVIDSGWFVLGSELSDFETRWASLCGVSHGVGVGNGMDAIEITLRSLNIGTGDEVITSPMTAFATVLAIIRSGATPVLADIDPSSALLSLDSVKRCLSSKTKAIIVVHLYGQVRNMNAWISYCAHNNIELIEDCAQAHLATSNGMTAGSFGIAGTFSFYPTKNLGAIGDGGMIVTGNIEIANRAKRIRNYGQSTRYQHPEIGMNSRLDELQAAILIERLNWLESFTERRRVIANKYRFGIHNNLVKQLEIPEENSAHVYHLYVVICDERLRLQEHLNHCGIQSLIHYPIPIHHQKPCIQIARDPLGLINSERHANQCLSIPCHPQMTEDDIQLVISSINSFK